MRSPWRRHGGWCARRGAGVESAVGFDPRPLLGEHVVGPVVIRGCSECGEVQ